MSDLIKININDPVLVQIKEDGWEYLHKKYDQSYIDVCIKSKEVNIDGEKWYKLQLWTIFDYFPPNFGGLCRHSTDFIINPNVI